MAKYQFDNNAAGMKTLWIAQFQQSEQQGDEKNYRQSCEVLIPSPIGKGWIPWIHDTQDTAHGLSDLQSRFSHVQQGHSLESQSLEDFLDKTKQVSEGLGSLSNLMEQFRKILEDIQRKAEEGGVGENPETDSPDKG